MMSRCLPRVVVASPASGQGTATVAVGLMAALAGLGLEVSGHRIGPGYGDTGWHALATGRPGSTLDPWLVSDEHLVPMLLQGAVGANLAILEGVLGLHDGRRHRPGFASTAQVAATTRTPVLLVVDVSRATPTLGAVLQGMAAFDPRIEVGGVILDQAWSARQAREVASWIDLPVLGVLERARGPLTPPLVAGPAPVRGCHRAPAALGRLARHVTDSVDLRQVMALADRAPDLESCGRAQVAAVRQGWDR